MDISLTGQSEMKKVIISRLNSINLDKLDAILSSNGCENYSGVLVKFSQGKRLNLDQSDSWRVLQAFVAGLRSNKSFTQTIRIKAGVLPSLERDRQMYVVNKIKEQSRVDHATDLCKKSRKVTKQIRAHLMGKDEKKQRDIRQINSK